MIALAVSLLAVAGFATAFVGLRVLAQLQGALSTTAAGLTAMTDASLDDEAKERAVQTAGFGLIKASFGIIWRFAAALSAAAVPIFGAELFGLVTSAEVFALMLRLDYIVAVSITALVLSALAKRLRGPQDNDINHHYSASERMLHALAFSGPGALKALSRLEDRLIGAPNAVDTAPIFVTSLARGGTTAVLNALHATPGIATHTYRDMPFLTAPTLGDRLAGGARRSVAQAERAHGDGMQIGLESAEAFEEVIWKMFWPERFRGDAIPLWTAADRHVEAETFLTRHMAKIVRARDGERYASKNNANIARLPLLRAAFSDAKIVIPVRRPETHAASLWRQHHNFLKRHADDAFTRRYMSDIGHFEFGALHKPLGFDGAGDIAHEADTQNYWLAYWVATFRAVLAHCEGCEIVLQDDLRAAPQETMGHLYDRLNIPSEDIDFQTFFRGFPDQTDDSVFDVNLLAEAQQIYSALAKRALRPSLAKIAAE